MNRKIVYLTSFYPLSSNKLGREAVQRFNLKPFIDGSCRREPDFENEFPCITSLCRPKFAAKLQVGDVVVYVTNKRGIGVRKVVAVLEVVERFENHFVAADWYRIKGKILPNNLMVEGNPAFPIEKTHRAFPVDQKTDTDEWDQHYQRRSECNPAVFRCRVVHLNLSDPKSMVFPLLKNGRKLIAQNPPILLEEEFNEILRIMNNTPI